MAKILDGKIVRDKIADKLKSEISRLGPKPKLVIVQVGDLAESNTYIRQKVLFGQKIGAIVEHKKFAQNISQEKLISQISSLNTDSGVTGIIIQLPIPDHLNKDALTDAIDSAKDVDGQTAINLKKLIENDPAGFVPATTKGILTLLNFYKIPLSGKNVCVVGRSTLVGKPTVLAILNAGATITVCHSQTKNLAQETKRADILIVAVGKADLITANHVSKGQVVIDVGINVVGNTRHETRNTKPELEDQRLTMNNEPASPAGGQSTKLVGDVKFNEVSKIVSAITPVPGGIGPMTVASLFENLLEAYSRKN